MKTLRMVVDVTYDDDLMHSGDMDVDARTWFHKDIIGGHGLSLHCAEVGDTLGKVNVLHFAPVDTFKEKHEI